MMYTTGLAQLGRRRKGRQRRKNNKYVLMKKLPTGTGKAFINRGQETCFFFLTIARVQATEEGTNRGGIVMKKAKRLLSIFLSCSVMYASVKKLCSEMTKRDTRSNGSV